MDLMESEDFYSCQAHPPRQRPLRESVRTWKHDVLKESLLANFSDVHKERETSKL